MAITLARTSVSLDVGCCRVAICVTSLLGLFLLFAWMQDRIRRWWWGAAYLIGGFSVRLWSWTIRSPPLPVGIANALLFLAGGMIWGAARLFHGRPVLWGRCSRRRALAGRLLFAGIHAFGGVAHCAELADLRGLYVPDCRRAWRERRKSLIRRWPAIFVPCCTGPLPFPVALATLSPAGKTHPRSGRLGRRLCHRDHASTWSAPPSWCWCWPRTAPYALQIGGGDRSADRRAQPSRLLRGCRRGHGGDRAGMEPVSVLAFRPRPFQVDQ